MYREEEIRLAEGCFGIEASHRAYVFNKLRERGMSPVHAEDIAAAMDELRDFVTSGDVLGWLAGLYDDEVGGFYFSNSAREGKEFLPDLESTRQAIFFFWSSGAGQLLASSHASSFPPIIGEKVVRFTKRMQDATTGYFYHPQWERSELDANISRLGRDLCWAIELLKLFGASPTYATPTGEQGDGVLWDGTRLTVCPKTDRLNAEGDETSVKLHLINKENFLRELAGLEDELKLNSWKIGNRFESEATQIVARDRVLAERGLDYSLADILVNWFAERQDPTTGAWTSGEVSPYDATNGILKISGAFNRMGRRLPNPIASLRTAIDCISSPKPVASVCHVLNPWYAVNNIVTNVSRFGCSGEENREAERLVSCLAESCASAVRITKKKLECFKIDDGSFTYSLKRSGLSQNMRVAPHGVWEGDVNATTIACRAIIEHIYEVIGVRMPSLFSRADAMRFYNALETKKSQK